MVRNQFGVFIDLDLDPHSSNFVKPDSHAINADPYHCNNVKTPCIESYGTVLTVPTYLADKLVDGPEYILGQGNDLPSLLHRCGRYEYRFLLGTKKQG